MMIVLNQITNNLFINEVITYISVKTTWTNSGYCEQYLRRLLRENSLEGIKIGQIR